MQKDYKRQDSSALGNAAQQKRASKRRNVNDFTTILGSLPHGTFVLGIDKGTNVYYFASNPSRVNALDPHKS